MENENAAFLEENRRPCYCWSCYTQAEFVEEFATVQEYKCPKCYVRIRVGDPEYFDPLRTPDDDSDSVSVCVSPSTSRRSTITNTTYSESEAGASDDVDARPVTPDIDLSIQMPSAPANTPADGDVPDAPPNIAKAFADVTNFLLNVPTSKRRSKRLSFGGLSSVSEPDSISPSKMIKKIVEAYESCSLCEDDMVEPETKLNDIIRQNIEIMITPSPDTKELKAEDFTRKANASEVRCENVQPEKQHGLKKE